MAGGKCSPQSQSCYLKYSFAVKLQKSKHNKIVKLRAQKLENARLSFLSWVIALPLLPCLMANARNAKWFRYITNGDFGIPVKWDIYIDLISYLKIERIKNLSV